MIESCFLLQESIQFVVLYKKYWHACAKKTAGLWDTSDFNEITYFNMKKSTYISFYEMKEIVIPIEV